jgi:hypothetical protein
MSALSCGSAITVDSRSRSLVDPFRSEPDVIEDVVVSGVAHATPHRGPRPRKVAGVDGVQREPEQ